MNRTMRKMRKMARRHRPIAKATNPLWRSQRFADTTEEVSTITRLRGELHAAGYPEIYPVDRATFDVIESYYKRVQASEVAKWKAAGEPDNWPNSLWLTWTRTGRGLQFKGCELVMGGD